jgi:hypothetical protein
LKAALALATKSDRIVQFSEVQCTEILTVALPNKALEEATVPLL